SGKTRFGTRDGRRGQSLSETPLRAAPMKMLSAQASYSEMRNPFLYRWLLSILTVVGGCLLSASAIAAEAGPAEASEAAVPLRPAELVHIGKFAVTNSMLVTWIVAAGIIVFAQIATRRIKPIPSGIQNFWDWLVESLYTFLEGIIGRQLVRKTVWFFAL